MSQVRGDKAPQLLKAAFHRRCQLKAGDAKCTEDLGECDCRQDLEHPLEELLEGDADGHVLLLQNPPVGPEIGKSRSVDGVCHDGDGA
jgi:hypothetical protein